jgi:hypothetical protein
MNDSALAQTGPQEAQSLESHLAEGRAASVGFDAVDGLAYRTLDELVDVAEPTLREAATSICAEGAAGPALRRLIVRDVLASRTNLRFAQGARNLELRRYLSGSDNKSRLETLERIVDNEHRRLLASTNVLTSLERTASRVSISAKQAAVYFEGDAP